MDQTLTLDWSSPDAAGIRHSQPLALPGIPGERPLSLWRPPGEGPWPLALFFDGQNLFDAAGTMAGGWNLHQQLSQRAAAGLPVPLVIGLHHGPERERELSPFDPFPDTPGQGKALLDWLTATLLPALNADLPLSQDPDEQLLGGSSLGGLLALYGLFAKPDHFGRALVMSPALWPERFAVFQALMMLQPREASRIYLDHGQREVLEAGKEHLGQLLFEQTQLLADLLEVMGFARGERLCWNPDPLGEHNEASWSRRLPAALDFLYGGAR